MASPCALCRPRAPEKGALTPKATPFPPSCFARDERMTRARRALIRRTWRGQPDILCNRLGPVGTSSGARTCPWSWANDKPGHCAAARWRRAQHRDDAGALRAQAGPGVGGGGLRRGASCWRPASDGLDWRGRCGSIPSANRSLHGHGSAGHAGRGAGTMPIRWRPRGHVSLRPLQGRAAGVGGGALGWAHVALDGNLTERSGRDRRKPGLRRGRPDASRLPRRARPRLLRPLLAQSAGHLLREPRGSRASDRYAGRQFRRRGRKR